MLEGKGSSWQGARHLYANCCKCFTNNGGDQAERQGSFPCSTSFAGIAAQVEERGMCAGIGKHYKPGQTSLLPICEPRFRQPLLQQATPLLPGSSAAPMSWQSLPCVPVSHPGKLCGSAVRLSSSTPIFFKSCFSGFLYMQNHVNEDLGNLSAGPLGHVLVLVPCHSPPAFSLLLMHTGTSEAPSEEAGLSSL